MAAIAQYIFLTCLRARLLLGVAAMLAVAFGLAVFIGNTALVEENETARALAAGSMRLVMATGVTILICFHIQHITHSRELAVLAARPLARWRLVLGCFVSYAAISATLAILCGAAIASLGFHNVAGYLNWQLGFVLESIIIASVALMFGLILSNAVSACLASMSFYLLARMIILFVATAESPMSKNHGYIDVAVYYAIKAISLLMPRLDMFAESSSLIYGSAESSAAHLLLQAAIYVPMLLIIAVLDFERKEL